MININALNEYCNPTISHQELLKVIVIGDPYVGKTSFVKRYVDNTYTRNYKGTIGVDFELKIVQLSEDETIKLQLWDIAGQERFTWMTSVYYRGARGCVILFDITNRNSFLNTLRWKKDVDSKCALQSGRPLPCLLLANKSDLPQKQVDALEVDKFQKEHNFVGWTEISAKEGTMVAESMKFLIDVMMKEKYGRYDYDSSELLRLSEQCNKSRNLCKC